MDGIAAPLAGKPGVEKLMVGIAQIARVALDAAVLKELDRAQAEFAVAGQPTARRRVARGQTEVEQAVLGQKLYPVSDDARRMRLEIIVPHGRGHAAVMGCGHALGQVVLAGPAG